MEEIEGLVSVVLPIRQWQASTHLAVQSILDQSYRNIELLLIGQKCLNPLSAGLHSAQITDERIRLISRQSPGITGALNTGLAKSRGEYIARMDDDDIAYPQRLDIQLHYLHEHPQITLCAGGVRFVDNTGCSINVGAGNKRYANWLNQLTDPQAIALACYAENPMPHPTLLARRTIWKQLEGYREIDGPEDHDLILRAMLKGIRMGKPSAVVLDWRDHDARLTRTDTRYRREAFVALSAQALTQDHNALAGRPGRAVWIAGTGKQARNWHDELTALGVTVRGFVDVARPSSNRKKRQLVVITYEQLTEQRSDALLLCAVTQPAGRDAIRQFCHRQSWQEGTDFIMGS
ncbi:MAG: glycosyltransferase [Granulosicoccus sp.]